MNQFAHKKIGDIADFTNGRAFKPEEWSRTGLPIIRIQNLTGFSDEFNYFDGYFDERYLVKNGDILISWSASLGVYYWKRGDAVLNQHIFKVNLKNGVDKAYFFYAIQTKLKEMSVETHGSTMKHITKGRFENIRIPLPAFSIQQQIAAILEKADAAREKRRQANQLTEQFLQSVFLEMFGDPATNPKRWETVLLGEYTETITKGETPLWKGDSYLESGVLFLRSENVLVGTLKLSKKTFISPEVHDRMKRSQVKKHDVLLNIVGASIGRSAVFEKNCDANILVTG